MAVKLTTQIALHVSPRVAAAAQQAADRLEMKRSEYIRQALVRALRADGVDPGGAAR